MGRLFFYLQNMSVPWSCSLPPASNGWGRISIAGQSIPRSLCTSLHSNVVVIRTSGQNLWTSRWAHDLSDIGGGEGGEEWTKSTFILSDCEGLKTEWLSWYFKITTSVTCGTAVAQWLRCCATNRKVAGSIPAAVIGIFHWHKILPIALSQSGRLSL